MDPLSLVRQATVHHTAVNYVDGFYIFGKHKFHESTKTAFKRTHKSGGYYTLRDVIFFLENADLQLSEYRLKVNDAGVTAVVIQDRVNLNKFLTGEIDTCDQIDMSIINAGAPVDKSGEYSSLESGSSELSKEKMEEYRKKYAADIDEAVQASFKSATALSAESSIMTMDPEFLKADKVVLSRLRADEFAATTRGNVLRKPGADFSHALKLFNNHVLNDVGQATKTSLKRPREEATGSATPGKSSKSGGAPSPASASAAGGAIIIVPNSLTSTFCNLNALDLLRDGKFVTVEEKRSRGTRREPEQKFEHTMKNGKKIKFRVLDNGSKLRDSEWNRVAAVFAQGQSWQFKGWKWSNPVELFNNVFGIHVAMDDEEIDASIQSWNCKVLKINKTKRHLDASSVNEFWVILEDYLRVNKPWLLQ